MGADVFEFDGGDDYVGDDDGDEDYEVEGSDEGMSDEGEETKRERSSESESKPSYSRPRRPASAIPAKKRAFKKSLATRDSNQPHPRSKRVRLEDRSLSNAVDDKRLSPVFLDSDEDGSRNDDEEDSGAEGGSDEDHEVIVEVGGSSSEPEDDAVIAEMAGANKDLKKDALDKLAVKGFVDTYYGDDPTKYYEAFDMCTSTPKLSAEAEDAAKSMRAIDVFLFFLPKKLWHDIAVETNRYERQTRKERVEKMKVRTNELPSRLAEVYIARARK
jgi:hypothetical protein